MAVIRHHATTINNTTTTTTTNNNNNNNNDGDDTRATQDKLRAKCATRRAVVERLVHVVKAALNNNINISNDDDNIKLQEAWCEYSPPDPSVLMIKKDGRVLAKDQPMCLVVRLFIKHMESFVDEWIAGSAALIEDLKTITSACDKSCVVLHDADDRAVTRVLFCCT
jgi:hypothetical protein